MGHKPCRPGSAVIVGSDPAFAQIDLSGEWAGTFHEDLPHRGRMQLGGSLKVVTTNLRAGYFRRNGVPYSEDTVVTEYFDRLTAEGADWLTVFTIVDDPRYLNQPFITSTHFKREPDAAKWMPTPCEPTSRASR